MSDRPHAYRGAILHFLDDPDRAGENAYEYHEDGLLVVIGGRIQQLGAAPALLAGLDAAVTVSDYGDHLITPGFIDSHVHYPQIDVIASHGKQLLDWLNDYTYPAEMRYADADHARRHADAFLDELLRNGTTTAMVFCTVHPQSVDAFFECTKARGLRMIAGKVMMDRNAPAALLDTAESAYRDSCELIERWHGRDRLHYAVTPRFAPTSSPAQLAVAGRLLNQFPEVYLQTHLAESVNEIAWVRELFPHSKHYVDVYDSNGMLGPRSVFAHGIHLEDDEYRRLAASGSTIAFCPTSNSFIGSGLFDLARTEQYGIAVAIATDIGGGTSFSLLQTLAEGYKVQQLNGAAPTPLKLFYLPTLGAARALSLDDTIGNFVPGNEADFVVWDLHSTPLLARRVEVARTLSERLFALAILGDDRAASAVYSNGRLVHRRTIAGS